MLSLRHCRDLAGAAAVDLSDEELAVLVEQLYSLAALTVDAATGGKKRGRLRLVGGTQASPPSFSEALDLMTDDQRWEMEERAAILEYDAKIPREEAERAAIVMSNQSEEEN